MLTNILKKCMPQKLITSGFFSKVGVVVLGGGISSELWATATGGMDTELAAC